MSDQPSIIGRSQLLLAITWFGTVAGRSQLLLAITWFGTIAGGSRLLQEAED